MSPAAPVSTAVDRSVRRPRFIQFSWFVLVFNVGIVLWGAYVRATGSGAGCGSHWPLCNGEVIPRARDIQQVIEFTHRLTSGLGAILVLVLFTWARRAFAAGSPVRRMAGYSLLLMATEALLGAGLVLMRLVEKNDSLARAFMMPLHLINTLLLLASLTATAWYATTRLAPSAHRSRLTLVALLLTVLIGVSGAIAALGDTLFPATSLSEGLRQDVTSGAHFLLRLRVIHPAIALVGAVTGFLAAFRVSRTQEGRPQRIALVVILLFVLQLCAGVINLVLLAPVWLQITHLMLADALWIALVLLYLAGEGPGPVPAHADGGAVRH